MLHPKKQEKDIFLIIFVKYLTTIATSKRLYRYRKYITHLLNTNDHIVKCFPKLLPYFIRAYLNGVIPRREHKCTYTFVSANTPFSYLVIAGIVFLMEENHGPEQRQHKWKF